VGAEGIEPPTFAL